VASTEKGAPKWALLVLVLTSRKEFKVALSIIEVGLLEVEPQEQVLLLRIKARVHQIQGAPLLARNVQEIKWLGARYVCLHTSEKGTINISAASVTKYLLSSKHSSCLLFCSCLCLDRCEGCSTGFRPSGCKDAM
jgi:predicted transport protein